ncbi:hypothetical protein O3438_17440 [Micromonospora sp. WMMC250]|nr:hypothetical protein [Micromonospora sp. WMMC250]MCZ7376687.1 hypothetical protein [Micromonospora sp. WMMC250]
MEQVLRVGHLVLIRCGLRAQLGDGIGDPVSHLDLVAKFVVAARDGLKGTCSQGGDVPGEGRVRVGGVEPVVLDQSGIDLLKTIGQLTSDQMLVEPSLKIRHSSKIAAASSYKRS